jgi:hypothetical protein
MVLRSYRSDFTSIKFKTQIFKEQRNVMRNILSRDALAVAKAGANKLAELT